MSTTLHTVAAVTHFVQAVYTSVLSVTYDNEIVLPVKFKDEVLWEQKLSPYIAAFSLLSSVNHTLTLIQPNTYASFVERECNPWRWAEYSISATLMMITISQLSAVYDIDKLTMIALLTPMLMYIGFLTEIYKDVSLAKTLFVIGCLILLTIWVSPMVSFIDAVQSNTRKPPDVVYVIVIGLFALFSCFGVVNYLHITNRSNAESRFYNFTYVEGLYVILSLISKTLLANLTLSGAIFRDQDTV